ncbi:MAG TPA: hypothetical protein DEF43_18410 [Chloroflexus aurantiacus]|uniref:hypothetical protein n=1 Tax=Chloroflexus TaxID=1107 RepID=UPI0005C66015|nr:MULTISPECIES: hypothetical protein [Chloroflexus]RMG51522.1 MAG: hypothetical protein D6716_05705 [Chloroflexota bacterium]HBW69081.1 hypothetical protein [Chloroflexus aurantiacus]
MRRSLMRLGLLTPPPPPAPPSPPPDVPDQQALWLEAQCEQDGRLLASTPFWHPKAIRRMLRLPMA